VNVDLLTVPQPVRVAGRSVFRWYGSISADMRPLPDFILIGTKRGGTTSAYFHLLRHPDVLPMFPEARWLPKGRDGKGPHYFDSHFDRGERWYRGHFPSSYRRRTAQGRTGRPPLSGEASPYYLFHPHAPARMHALMPDVKLLVALRNPIERAYSHFREQARNGIETLSFEEALLREQRVLPEEAARLQRDPDYRSHAHEQQSYVGQSEYAMSLRRWLDLFPQEQLHVWFSEDYYAHPSSVLGAVASFLGLSPFSFPSAERLNAAPPAPLEPSTRGLLRARLEPDVRAVEAILGVSTPWVDFG
jgi:hypothetical protein